MLQSLVWNRAEKLYIFAEAVYETDHVYERRYLARLNERDEAKQVAADRKLASAAAVFHAVRAAYRREAEEMLALIRQAQQAA